jgi:hypothetical protein
VLTASRPETDVASSSTTSPGVAGPQWYRERIRRYGPWLAVAVPAAVGTLAVLALALFEGLASGWAGLILGVAAAPGLLVIGVPFASSDTWWIGIVLSVPLWLVVGYLTARTATRNPVATFSDYWRAYRWLLAGVWVGVAAALIGATALLGRQLL